MRTFLELENEADKRKQAQQVHYDRWEETVARQPLQDLPEEILFLVDRIAQIGDIHARKKEPYQRELRSFIIKWAEEAQYFQSPNQKYDNHITTNFTFEKVYALGEQNGYTKRVTQEREFVKHLIPISYVILGTVFLSLSIIFGFKFYLGFHGGGFLIGPWANLMLLIGAAGLTVTVIAACIEWRRKMQHGPLPKDGKRK